MGIFSGKQQRISEDRRAAARRHRGAGKSGVTLMEFDWVDAAGVEVEFVTLNRSFLRPRTPRSVWATNTSFMKIFCRSSPTTTCCWPNWTRTSGHWRAGRSAPNPAAEVCHSTPAEIYYNNFRIITSFLKEVSYAYRGCIYVIKNTVKTVIIWNITTVFYLNRFQNFIYSCDAKLNFQLWEISCTIFYFAVEKKQLKR